MRKTLRASFLVLVFCCPVSDGIVLTPPVAPPPAVQEPPTDGDIETPLTTNGEIQNGAADGIMANEAAATFIEVVLNLLTLP